MGTSDFTIRSLTSDATGVCEVGEHGYGVEILDGGNYERANLIELGRSDSKYDSSFTGDNVIACNPGARIAGEFDTLKLVVPVAAVDTVKVLIITRPNATWVATDPHGKARVRWFARGKTVSLAANTCMLLYDSGVAGEPDRFSLQEQFETFNFWQGYIAGRRNFVTYVQVQPYNVPGSSFQIQQAFNAKNYSVLPAYLGVPPTGLAYVNDFTQESAGVAGQLARYPNGQIQIFICNNDTNAGAFTYLLGVRSF